MQSVNDVLKQFKTRPIKVCISTSILKCCCGSVVSLNHPQFRGRLVNEIARLGSEVIRTREQIADLKSKRNPSASDVSLRHDLEQRLPRIEGEFFGFRFLEREVFLWAK